MGEIEWKREQQLHYIPLISILLPFSLSPHPSFNMSYVSLSPWLSLSLALSSLVVFINPVQIVVSPARGHRQNRPETGLMSCGVLGC